MSDRILERKRLGKPIRLDAAGQGDRTFTGHASVFDDPHPTSSWLLGPDWQDVVRPGAFRATLADHKRLGTLPAMFYDHDPSHVIGAWRSVAEDGDGLAVDGQLAKSARLRTGEDLYELLSMGAISGLSIGFFPEKVKLDEKTKTREILATEVFEISPTPIPGNARARIADVKNAAPGAVKRFLEETLRDAGLSRTEAKAVLSTLRDAGDEGAEKVGDVRAYLRTMLPIP